VTFTLSPFSEDLKHVRKFDVINHWYQCLGPETDSSLISRSFVLYALRLHAFAVSYLNLPKVMILAHRAGWHWAKSRRNQVRHQQAHFHGAITCHDRKRFRIRADIAGFRLSGLFSFECAAVSLCGRVNVGLRAMMIVL